MRRGRGALVGLVQGVPPAPVLAAWAALPWPEKAFISMLPTTMPPATPAAVVRAEPRKLEPPPCWNMPGW